MANNEVWLLTHGDGSDGDGWAVLGIYTSEKLAQLAKTRYEPYWGDDGIRVCRSCQVEKWRLDWDVFDMSEPPSASVRMGEK